MAKDALTPTKRKISFRRLRRSNREMIRRSGVKLKSAIAAGASIIVVGTVLLLWSLVTEQRNDAGDYGWREIKNLTGVFYEKVSGIVDNMQGAVVLIKPELLAQGASFDLASLTHNLTNFIDTTVQIALFDPNGKFLASSIAPNLAPIDLSDRKHIGRTFIGRISQRLPIRIPRRIENNNGDLAYEIVFSLSPHFLARLYNSIDFGETGSMLLIEESGVVLASYGKWALSNVVGKPVPSLKRIIDKSKTTEGQAHCKAPVSGAACFFGWKKINGSSLFVVVGFEESEIFDATDSSAFLLALLGIGVVVLQVTTTVVLCREITRRVKREISLFEQGRTVFLSNQTLQRRHRQLQMASVELNAERTRLQGANIALKAAKEEADGANQAKTSFLMNMSHEFRTPMHAILNYTNMGLKKIDVDDRDKLKKYLRNIQISGLRLLELLNALLDLAKLECGKFELKPSRSDVLQIVRQSQTELDSLFESKSLELIVRCESKDTFAFCDDERLMQVFINLFSNAIKFSPKETSIDVSIEDVMSDAGPSLLCIVSDHGIGIPSEEMETIFEKFRQSSKTDTGAGGSGLGLAICREIIYLHGGKIWAEASPSGGAAIHFTIPRDDIRAATFYGSGI